MIRLIIAGVLIGAATSVNEDFKRALVVSERTMTDLGTFGGRNSVATPSMRATLLHTELRKTDDSISKFHFLVPRPDVAHNVQQ